MELLNPIFVKRWVSENKYIEYVFDVNTKNNYKNIIVIKEYIFRDINIKDTLDKIAYHIYNYENKIAENIEYPYYFWSSSNNIDKSILFDIKKVLWKGYNQNPFKSYDRDSQQLKEPIEYVYNEDILNIDILNIVFYNDFKYDNKYYYPDIKHKFVNNLNKKLEDNTIALYNTKIIKAKEKKEDYFNISFSNKYDIESLIVLFDNFKTNEDMQLIQLINNNNAIYKLYKYHTIEDKELNKIFNLNNNKEKESAINIYYGGENIKLNISNDGVFTIHIVYNMDKGENITVINKIKYQIIEYLNNYLKIDVDDFKVQDINSRITYSINYIDTSLIKKIGLYSNIFQDFEKNTKEDKKNVKDVRKNVGFFTYKRSNNIDIDNYIRSRSKIRNISKDEIFNELKSMGINRSISDINKIISNMKDIEDYKLIKTGNAKENNSSITVIVNNDNIEVITNNIKSYFELENLKYWIIRIIEKSKIDKPSKQIKDSPKILPIENKKNITENSSESSKTSESSKSKSKNSKKSESSEYSIKSDEYIDNRLSSGGGKTKDNYLINRLNIADKELWKGNKARNCQPPHQPIVLLESELEELKLKGYDKKLDNIIKHGSTEDNQNYYTCPRIWCPISNTPLNEDEYANGTKCPDENEKPMMLNEIMNNANKPRYAYRIDKHNIPCCGTKNPDLKKVKLDKPKKINTEDKQQKGKRGRKAKKDILIKNESIEVKKESDNIIEDDQDVTNNYIMTQIPIIYKNRYGNIRKELYRILYNNNYKDYLSNCINRNNINKHSCILRKGIKDIPANKKLNNYDNIIDVIAFLLGKTRDGLLKDIEKRLDIITFLSLENGNVFKDFSDIEPVIPEFNIKLYEELLNKFNNNLLLFPKLEDNSKKSLYSKSRLLSIYNAYKKFINYLKSTDSKYDKNIQYIYSLVAILYKRLIISWEIDKGIDNNVQIICPYYTTFNDLIHYLGKNPKMIMIYKDNNNDKDNINTPIYEPLVSRTINTRSDTKSYNLKDHEDIKNILMKCSADIIRKDYSNDIYDNKINIQAIIRRINNIENNNSEEIYGFNTLIINNDLSIDKIILNNNVIISFKKQSIIFINLIIQFFNIKKIVFSEDIIGEVYDISIKNDVHEEFIKDTKSVGINVEPFEIKKETKIITKGTIKFKDNNIDDNIVLNSDYSNKFHKYVSKTKKNIEDMYEIRKYIKEKLLDATYTDEFYNNLSKYSRSHIIKTLLKDIANTDKYDPQILQIVLEEIDVSSRNSIRKWYSLSLGNFKYDYINEISDNIVESEDGKELIFSQYLVSNPNTIPKNIISYKNYYPTNINYLNNPIEKTYEIKDDTISTKSTNIVNKSIPAIFKGIEYELNSKWKKIWPTLSSKLRYIKVNYDENYIKNLYEYLISYDKSIITNVYKFNHIIQYTYDEYEKILCDYSNISDLKRRNNKLIRKIFKEDPHFYTVYIKTMNILNKSNISFKTENIFLESYFNKSSITERQKIIQYIKKEESIKYYSDITLKIIATWLNINIFIIRDKQEYGKGIGVKRNGVEDFNNTSVFYRAGKKIEDILKRPLLMLYREKNKINKNISYYIIKLSDSNSYIYKEFEEAPEDIKNKLINLKYDSNDSLMSTKSK